MGKVDSTGDVEVKLILDNTGGFVAWEDIGPMPLPTATIDTPNGTGSIVRSLPITTADIWADYSAALELDAVQPFDASWKSVYEIMALAADCGLTISRKTAQVQAQRAIAAGRMERQWQMRETTAGPRRMVVYRVVNGEKGGD